MDATYIFLCGIVWARSQEEAAALELIRATASPVPELRVLARVMLQQGEDHSRQLIGEALSQGQMSAVQANLCAFEGEPSARCRRIFEEQVAPLCGTMHATS
jgi:hypothetical protein